MNNYDISVIIPIYNAERYLRECVDFGRRYYTTF